MPSKPVRQSAKYREQQLRKKTTAGGRPAGSFDAAELTDESALPAGTGEISTMRFAPTAAAATSATTAPRPATAPARRLPSAVSPTAAVRTQRGRVAAQMHEMSLADEMAFIRSDIQRMLVLALAAFALLIALSFVL